MTLERGRTVLVRDGDGFTWKKACFVKEIGINGHDRYVCHLPENFATTWKQCILFEDNEYLEDTTMLPIQKACNKESNMKEIEDILEEKVNELWHNQVDILQKEVTKLAIYADRKEYALGKATIEDINHTMKLIQYLVNKSL